MQKQRLLSSVTCENDFENSQQRIELPELNPILNIVSTEYNVDHIVAGHYPGAGLVPAVSEQFSSTITVSIIDCEEGVETLVVVLQIKLFKTDLHLHILVNSDGPVVAE